MCAVLPQLLLRPLWASPLAAFPGAQTGGRLRPLYMAPLWPSGYSANLPLLSAGLGGGVAPSRKRGFLSPLPHFLLPQRLAFSAAALFFLGQRGVTTPGDPLGTAAQTYPVPLTCSDTLEQITLAVNLVSPGDRLALCPLPLLLGGRVPSASLPCPPTPVLLAAQGKELVDRTDVIRTGMGLP